MFTNNTLPTLDMSLELELYGDKAYCNRKWTVGACVYAQHTGGTNILRTDFIGNKADYAGVGSFPSAGSFKVDNCLFDGNEAFFEHANLAVMSQ